MLLKTRCAWATLCFTLPILPEYTQRETRLKKSAWTLPWAELKGLCSCLPYLIYPVPLTVRTRKLFSFARTSSVLQLQTRTIWRQILTAAALTALKTLFISAQSRARVLMSLPPQWKRHSARIMSIHLPPCLQTKGRGFAVKGLLPV